MLIDRAESLLANGIRAQENEGDLQAARRWFEAAYRAADEVGDARAMARAVLGLSGIWVHEHRTAAAAGLMRSRLEHVLSLVDPDSELALRLRIRLAGEDDYRDGRSDRILARLAEARAYGDPVARAEALSIAHHCLLGPDDAELRRAIADELIGEGARTGRRSDLLMGLLWRVADMFLEGDPHAERRLAELRALLADEHHLAIGFVVSSMEVMLAIRAGRFEEAEHLAKECAERGVEAGDADATGWYGAQLVAIRWYQGRLPELLPMLIELVHSPTLSAVDNSFFAALALASAMAGDEATASSTLATLRGQQLADLPRSSSWLVLMYGVIEAAHRLNNRAAAARAYAMLLPYRNRPMTASLAVACFGSVHHALGVAALTMGKVDHAIAHLREAVHRNLALGHWPAVITARLRLAEALERRGGADDLSEAGEHRAKADDVGAMLGIRFETEPAGTGATVVEARLTRQGRKWRIDVGHRTVVVEHSVGMLHLAVLTANPGVEIPAVELVAGVDALSTRGTAMSAQPVLDRNAVLRYRQRLSELDNEIDEAELSGDPDRAAKASGERQWLLAELSAGTGLGGRPRSFADDGERARLAVGKAIRRSLAHIESADPRIGAHLREGVHTGVRCWYRPLPD